MTDGRGGSRPGAGRRRGSKNKMTIAKEAVAEVLDLDDRDMLSSEIHRRGHRLLMEVERIAMDPTQPIAIRIIAIRTALPFLLSKPVPAKSEPRLAIDLVRTLEEGRQRVTSMRR